MKKSSVFCLGTVICLVFLASCASVDVSYLNAPAVLRSSAPYSDVADDAVEVPVIKDVDPVRTAQIREYFAAQGLDLAAISASESTTWDKTLEIATFVAENIPHANQKQSSELGPVKNAITLWEYHLNIENAFNCRWHAILLSELLLAAGIDACYVTCLPKVDDGDCHVINQVWLPELDKWAMIDSDGRHYITNPDAIPLSISEIRSALIDDIPLTVHNLTSPATSSQWYLNYLSKDFYWFEAASIMGYDVESRNPESGTYVRPDLQWIQLRPIGYDDYYNGELVARSESTFWAAPDTFYNCRTIQ